MSSTGAAQGGRPSAGGARRRARPAGAAGTARVGTRGAVQASCAGIRVGTGQGAGRVSGEAACWRSWLGGSGGQRPRCRRAVKESSAWQQREQEWLACRAAARAAPLMPAASAHAPPPPTHPPPTHPPPTPPPLAHVVAASSRRRAPPLLQLRSTLPRAPTELWSSAASPTRMPPTSCACLPALQRSTTS